MNFYTFKYIPLTTYSINSLVETSSAPHKLPAVPQISYFYRCRFLRISHQSMLRSQRPYHDPVRFRNQTVGQLLTNLLCPFLQNGFAVIKELLRLKIGQDPLVDVSFGLFKTAIQINGAKHGLHDIRNDGISLPPVASSPCQEGYTSAGKCLWRNRQVQAHKPWRNGLW